MISVDGMNALDGLAHFLRRAKLVVDRDAADDENVSVEFNFAHGLRSELAVRGINLARFQRASEGSGESPGGCRDDVIKRRGMRRVSVRRNFVMPGNFGVYAENDRLCFRRQEGQTHWPALPFDANPRSINDFA